MTQSGQGEHPHLPSGPAHEGVVLPADGSRPLMPGAVGDQTTPAGGTPWGQPWGPQAPAPGTGATPGQSWDGGDQQGAGAQQWGAAPGPALGYGAPDQGAALPPAQAPSASHGGVPLPPEGAPYTGQPGPLPPAAYDGGHAAPLPPAAPMGHGAPLPPVAEEAATQYLPPVPGGAQPGMPGALPPEAQGEFTARLGRVPQGPQGHGGADNEATQFLAPAGSDEQPTQFISPVAAAPNAQPYGIRPGAPGDRQPPAEFDSLFRTQPEPGAAGSTQQLPRFEPGGARPAPAPGAYQADGYDAGRDGGGRGQRRAGAGGRRGKGPLIAAVGVGIVVIGVGAGALLSAGGDDGKDSGKPVSATAPSNQGSSPAADPAKTQAVELDKLLADSNDSRAAVIKAVGSVKTCSNLGTSATDLRDAAKQRTGLVTRLAQLAVDKLPAHDQLTAALNDAWRASASADNHYAAWADQVAGSKKNCRKGTARNTVEAARGNKASGDATRAKNKAAGLWNAIAKQYGLTERSTSQL